jgi:hypothetical protein
VKEGEGLDMIRNGVSRRRVLPVCFVWSASDRKRRGEQAKDNRGRAGEVEARPDESFPVVRFDGRNDSVERCGKKRWPEFDAREKDEADPSIARLVYDESSKRW